jgi:hypothetical protein
MMLHPYCVLYGARIMSLEFCSRKCYLAFWKDVPDFYALRGAKKSEKSACASETNRV